MIETKDGLHLRPRLKVKAMRIGELAGRTRLSTSKIRFYEACGLLPIAARSENGYRDFGERDVRVVTFVDRAQRLGFTLREIGTHLASPEGPSRKADLEAKLEAKLVELDVHMEQVHQRRALILDLVAEVRQSQADSAQLQV